MASSTCRLSRPPYPKQHPNTPPQAGIILTRLSMAQPEPLFKAPYLTSQPRAPIGYDGRLSCIPKECRTCIWIQGSKQTCTDLTRQTPCIPTHTVRARVQSRAAGRTRRAACGPAKVKIRNLSDTISPAYTQYSWQIPLPCNTKSLDWERKALKPSQTATECSSMGLKSDMRLASSVTAKAV